MGQQPKPVITDAPWIGLTYQIIGLAMALHNELGPGHRESAYHNGMVIKLQSAGRVLESEPYVPVTLADGTVVKGQCPDLVVERMVIVELKAHVYTFSRDEQAQVIGYFAALPECPVAFYLNFGRPRLEYRRLFPPTTVQAYRRGQ
jgi:GxxExxY protein